MLDRRDQGVLDGAVDGSLLVYSGALGKFRSSPQSETPRQNGPNLRIRQSTFVPELISEERLAFNKVPFVSKVRVDRPSGEVL